MGLITGCYWKAFYRLMYSEVASGAYDQANLFILLITRILRPGGSYGVIMPQSNLSPGGSDGLQLHINSQAIPRRFWVFENPRLFGGANVFICALSGLLGHRPKCTLVSVMPREKLAFETYEGPPLFADPTQATPMPWWTWIGSVRSGKLASAKGGRNAFSVDFLTIADLADVFAGCATGVAYELADIVSDNLHGSGLKLITTGAIDRFVCFWGVQEQKYLKKKYRYPRWPDTLGTSQSIQRASVRQTRSKIVMGGLTKTLEACFDRVGDLGGVVSTWILAPKKPAPSSTTSSPDTLGMLELLLNSYALSWIYSNNYGAQKSPWGGMTIKKDGILALRVPAVLFGNAQTSDGVEWIAATPWRNDTRDPSAVTQAACFLCKCVDEIRDCNIRQRVRDILPIDRSAQATICWLYGYSQSDFDDISTWFREREKVDSEAIAVLSASANVVSRDAGQKPDQAECLFEAELRAPTHQDVAQRIVEILSSNEGWLTKAEIIGLGALPTSHWQVAITQLLAGGVVERKGQRRGARYGLIDRTRTGTSEENP